MGVALMSDKIILIYAARHGTTVLNGNSFRGHINVPLDAQGIRDAHKLAYYFEPIPVSKIIASDKLRAMQTAHIIADRKNTDVIPTPSLHPWDVGDFSGQPKNKENKDKLQEYIDNPDRPIPGGESLNTFKQRVRPCLAQAIDVADRNGTPVLLVVHSSIIHELGSLFNEDHDSTLVEPGGAAAAYAHNGRIKAEAIFKSKVDGKTSSRADTIS